MKPILVLLLTVSVFFSSCGRFSNKQNEANKNSAVRIVCVSKQLTEILFALGQGDKIVGIDISSTYPPETKNITTVGYHRMLSAEGIISLNPTVVYYNGGTDASIGPENVIKQLKEVGIPLKEYPGTPNIDSAKILIRQIAKEFGVEKRGEELCNKLDADMKTAQDRLNTFTSKPKVLVIHYGRASNNYFVMGNKGNQNSMIVWAGGVNAADTSGFKLLSSEVIAKSQPEIILATDFGYDRMGSEDKFVELPGLNLTPAAKNHKIYRIEEHDLIYLGPRTGENVLKIMDLIHKQ
ncbi:MAG: ABC transporter substrate-binding protein [Ignavibacteria bacterium]|nr:ABC transporter substrate-binding protein [Ignavibacteria bacterium]